MNLLPARVEGDWVVAGAFRLPRPAGPLPARLEVGVRPEHVTLGEGVEGGAAGEIVAVEPLGAETHVVVKVGELELRGQLRGFDEHRRGDVVRVSIDAARALLFDAEGEGARV
jgi:ABC-type sugar transport system ATPase subunit